MVYLLITIIILGVAYTIYKLVGMDARAYRSKGSWTRSSSVVAGCWRTCR